MNLENGSIVNQYKIISASCVMFRFHNESVYKVDFIVLKNDPYRQEECARRQQVTIEDFQTWVVSREDLILSKLVWAKDSKSELQLRDVKNMLTSECAMDYVTSRAVRLGAADLLHEVVIKDE